MIAYKLFRKMKDGSLKSLFINKKEVIPVNEWVEAKSYPTKGFQVRPGWHVTLQPIAPHLSEKGRVWKRVEIEDYTEIKRPASQGGTWLLANKLKVLE